MILQNGTRVRDRYLIESLVGQGGMGAVYRATDLHLGHSVAIKENLLQGGVGTEGSDSSGQTDSRRSQFEREAQILARLKHPGLPKVTDHFVIPDQGQYLVMEFVEGEDLSTRLKRTGPMGELEAIALIRRVCGILSYLHSQKPPIIHRDIKPANIRQTPEGDIVVVDFGVAKIFSSEATVTAARAVTPGFSPLEQYGGSQSTDERSDIYALGATLHHLVTGKRPPEATTRITQAGGKGLGWLDLPGVGEKMATVLRKSMELRPEDRYAKIGDFALALEVVEAASSLTQTRPATPGVVHDHAPTAAVAAEPPAGAPATVMAPTIPTERPVAAPPAAPTVVPATPVAPPPATAATTVGSAPVGSAPGGQGPGAAAPAPTPAPFLAPPPAYAPPPAERKNRLPLFIGVGVLALLLVGGGYMVFGRGGASGPRDTASTSPGTSPAETPRTPVDDRNNTVELPGAQAGAGGATPPRTSTGGGSDATPDRPAPGSAASTSTGTAATGNNPAAPAGGSPQSGRPATGGAPPHATDPGPPPPTNTGSATPRGTTNPPPSGGSDLVPLTDNPGRPPVSQTPPTTGSGAGTSVTPPASQVQTPPVPPPPAPVVTPPQTIPAPGSTPGTQATPPAGGTPSPAVVPAPTIGDTLVIDPSGAGGHGSLSDAIQAWKEAYEKDRRVRTLLLKPGTYPRSTTLFMGNAGRLIGSGPPGSVVINYSGSNPGLSLEGVDIIVKNITVRSNGKSALSATKGQARIENCEFSSTGSHAVQLNGASANISFTRCRMVTSSGRGLLVANGTARLENCDATGNQLGVEVSGGSLAMNGGSIRDNQGTGLRVRGSGRAELSGVTITANQRHGVSIEGGSLTLTNCTVTGNTQSGVFCAGGGGRVTITGGDYTKNLTGAIVDSCGAITKSGSVREK